VDSHLKGNTITGADGQRRIRQQGIAKSVGAEPRFLQQILCRPCFMRVNGHQHCVKFFKLSEFIPQLRDLIVADRSRIAVDEDQNDILLSLIVTQPNGFTSSRHQLEFRGGLTDARCVRLTGIPRDKLLYGGGLHRLMFSFHRTPDVHADIAIGFTVAQTVPVNVQRCFAQHAQRVDRVQANRCSDTAIFIGFVAIHVNCMAGSGVAAGSGPFSPSMAAVNTGAPHPPVRPVCL